MAITFSNRREGLTASRLRSVTYDFSASDGAATDITKATLGLSTVSTVYLVLATASGIAIDVTANDATKLTLDPSASGTGTVVFVGS